MPVREISNDLLAVAKKELNEEPERREKDIQYIKDWISKQPHLTPNTDDQWLIAFLRGCKFSLERTKEKFDNYYTMRNALPDFFKNRDPFLPELQEALKYGMFLPLPTLDDLGRRVCLMRPATFPPTFKTLVQITKMNFMVNDLLLRDDDHAVINGMVSILDLSNVTLAHMTIMTPPHVKKMSVMFQDGYPIRPKGMHYINTPTGFETVYNLFKSFMKEKLKRRLHVHGSDMESLFKHIPQKALPKEYGGEAGCIEDLTAYWKKKVEENRQWFLDDANFGVDEKKRPGKPKTEGDLFGLEGSFRQLNVD